MIRWIKENFGVKNFLVLILVIVMIVGFIQGPIWYNQILGNNFEGVTEAKIMNIVAKQSSFQHYNGTNFKTVGYQITYFYEVGNEKFFNTGYVKSDFAVNQIFDQFNSGKNCMIEINYSIEKPAESIITNLELKK